jgi:hypothetical protein
LPKLLNLISKSLIPIKLNIILPNQASTDQQNIPLTIQGPYTHHNHYQTNTTLKEKQIEVKKKREKIKILGIYSEIFPTTQ